MVVNVNTLNSDYGSKCQQHICHASALRSVNRTVLQRDDTECSDYSNECLVLVSTESLTFDILYVFSSFILFAVSQTKQFRS